MHPGTQQNERLAPPLDPALSPPFLRPDELDLATRLRLTLELARQLRFVDDMALHQGHWGEVLDQDLSLLLAELASSPGIAEEARVMGVWPRLSERQQWHYCRRLAEQLERWCARMELHAKAQATEPGASPAAARLLQLLQSQLDGDLGRLQVQLQPHFGVGGEAPLPLLGARMGPSTKASSTSASGPTLSTSALARALRQFWLGLCRTRRQLALLAAELLPASLQQGDHDPAMGALLAFIQLLQLSRSPLDRFTDRLTQFYYRDSLGFQPAVARADRVHVLLERDPRHARPVLLPQGCLLIGGKNERGQALHYRAEQELLLSTLKVEQLLSLRLHSDARISPEHQFAFATEAHALQLPAPTPEQAALPRARAWPLLGGGPCIGFGEARQGLALASPLLQLREGEREITLELQLSHPLGQDSLLQQAVGEEIAANATLEIHQAHWQRIFERLALFEGLPLPSAPSQAEQTDLHAQRLRELGRRTARHGRRQAALNASREKPKTVTGAWLSFLLALCLESHKPDTLRPRIGRLFVVWLSVGQEDLSALDLRALRRHAQRVLGDNAGPTVQVDNPLSLIYGSQPMERSLIFDRVFRGLWLAQLSSQQGWLAVPEVYAQRVDLRSERPKDAGGRLQLRISLGAGAPPVQACTPALHGAGWPALPVLQLRMSGQTRVFGCSLLQQLALESARLQVRVSGVREMTLYNQLGRLDASKPFLPFGPLPDRSSYLMFSNAELSAKPISELSLQLQWAGLPSQGMAAHYAVYAAYADAAGSGGAKERGARAQRRWDESSYLVRPALLSGGHWQEGGELLRLFAERGPEQTLNLDGKELQRLHQPLSVPGAAADYTLSSRQGFFRLQLQGAESAFGHTLYPRLLSERLTQNSRIKRAEDQLPLPQEPYTPRLEKISLSYAAEEHIAARQDRGTLPGQSHASQLLQLCPFGLQALQRGGADQRYHLLAHWPCGAQLYIGLSGTASAGSLSLLFQLQAESAAESLGRPRPQLSWAAWCGQQWRELEPYRLLLDETQGLLRTGIMVLDLPEGMSADCPELSAAPGGPLLWLRLTASGELGRLAPMQGLWAQAISARRVTSHAAGMAVELPAQSIHATQPAIAGLASVRQPLPSFDLREAEDEAQLRTRVAERLRHRDRALTPWDIERLVLQEFPQVQKLKCLPLGAQGQGRQQVLVVVVPALPPGREIDGTEAPRLDAAILDEITAFLRQRAVPDLPLLVRNAVYDRIQVRCRLKLKAGVAAGERLRQLHQALRDYLSPWRPGGITTRFDWQVRADEIEAHLRAQAGVDSVGEVSLLHIIRNDRGRYRLADSARGSNPNLIRPSKPWSLALPTRKHLLELSDSVPRTAPRTTGLARLALGSSFIIGGAQA
ncbi:hypothetical protein [Paucibacter sp. DJ2R-2]|uniref:hypothetical protein n=1 Tax=Paucibacter sp. DJ2R-2 TaxID=2893558 RepID=UPI0021E3A9E4|nr:hypothetical protein [Paucibacter sp. DJ2R-2]MCV2423501.1 hypothetical protein [Paucibacter sp. DJ4R-1]MCV2440553.1 hypothetical protein [Paucibacter sp. DJ2R-2]